MSDYFERVERQIVRQVETGLTRTRRGRLTLGNLAIVAAVLVVIVVAGVFLAARGNQAAAPAPASHPAFGLGFTASPPDTSLIDQSVRLLRERLRAVLPGARVTPTADGLTVTLAHRVPGARSRILALAAPGRLAVYDWEADVVAPNGKTVGSQLLTQDPAALEISQGTATAAPGDPRAGSMSFHQARALARTAVAPGGFVLLHATGGEAGFYVLRGTAAVTNADVVDPHASTEANAHVPDVTFELTPRGRRAFQALTATIAERGDRVSGLGQTLNQHFAVAIDNHLITVPYVDYRVYPDGVDATDGLDILGNFTVQSAKDMAALLRYGPLPVNLTAAG